MGASFWQESLNPHNPFYKIQNYFTIIVSNISVFTNVRMLIILQDPAMKKRPIGILPITPEMEIDECARDVSKHYICKAITQAKPYHTIINFHRCVFTSSMKSRLMAVVLL